MAQAETNPQRPTTGQLLGDAFAYMRLNFRTFLVYGGGLIAVSKTVKIIVSWVQYDVEVPVFAALGWLPYFLTVFVKALLAYNVHRYILFGQRQFSFALSKNFWLFFAAVVAIEMAFFIPGELFENFMSVERLSEWRRAETPLPAPLWFMLGPLAAITTSFFVFILVAIFLTVPPSIVAHGKINFDANLKTGRALYWQIFSGLLILHLILSLYGFLVGLGQFYLLGLFVVMDDTYYSLYSMTLLTVLLAPISFFHALLGATFTSAVFIRGSEYLGLPKAIQE